MHGCSGGHALFAPGGACVVAPWGGMRGCSRRPPWLLLGGHAWLLLGGHVWLLLGGMRGCSWVACMVAPRGGMRGIRWDTEIRLMSGRYTSYWNAFLFEIVSHIWLLQFLNLFLFLQRPPPPYSQHIWRHSSVDHAAQAAGSSSQLMMHNVPPNVPAAPTQSLGVIPATIPTDLTQRMLVDPVLSSEGGVSMGPGVQNTFQSGLPFQPPLQSVLLEVLWITNSSSIVYPTVLFNRLLLRNTLFLYHTQSTCGKNENCFKIHIYWSMCWELLLMPGW